MSVETKEERPPTFTELAMERRIAAWREAAGVEALIYFSALYPGEVGERTLAEARQHASRLGATYRLLVQLIMHEQEVRAILSASERPRAGGDRT